MIVQLCLGNNFAVAPMVFPVPFNGRCRVKVVRINFVRIPAVDNQAILRLYSRVLGLIYFQNVADTNYSDQFVLEDVDIGGLIDLKLEDADGLPFDHLQYADMLLTLDIEYQQ